MRRLLGSGNDKSLLGREKRENSARFCTMKSQHSVQAMPLEDKNSDIVGKEKGSELKHVYFRQLETQVELLSALQNSFVLIIIGLDRQRCKKSVHEEGSEWKSKTYFDVVQDKSSDAEAISGSQCLFQGTFAARRLGTNE